MDGLAVTCDGPAGHTRIPHGEADVCRTERDVSVKETIAMMAISTRVVMIAIGTRVVMMAMPTTA